MQNTVNNIRLGKDKYGNTVRAIWPRGMVKQRGLGQSNQKELTQKGDEHKRRNSYLWLVTRLSILHIISQLAALRYTVIYRHGLSANYCTCCCVDAIFPCRFLHVARLWIMLKQSRQFTQCGLRWLLLLFQCDLTSRSDVILTLYNFFSTLMHWHWYYYYKLWMTYNNIFTCAIALLVSIYTCEVTEVPSPKWDHSWICWQRQKHQRFYTEKKIDI